jgi:predicted RNA-binding Zn ribbon-like protein
MPVSSSPPHELQLVIDFVNTSDLETGTDELATAPDLGEWLAARGLAAGDAPVPKPADHAQALALRDSLRSIMLAHNGHAPDPGAIDALERTAQRGQLAVHFAPDGTVGPAALGSGVAGALARVLIPVAAGAADGSWERVKACRAQDCQWAFYDASRNRSGRWCNMAVCGNRHKVRAYRERSGA